MNAMNAINPNKLIDGSSIKCTNTSKAVAIQDLVKRFNGSGLKISYIFFLRLLKMMADILKFTETPIIDESIEEYEYHEYEPITGTSINNGGDVRISIESQDVFTHPSQSYLTFEGCLRKADGTVYANADKVAVKNNEIMHILAELSITCQTS